MSYLEAGGEKRFLAPVIKHFAATPLVRIDQDAIDRGARKLYPDAADATRNRQFYTPTCAVLKHAAKRGWCSLIALERPRQPKGKDGWLTVEEAERLIAASGASLRPLVEFLFLTGARVGEALWLDWRDLDLARRHVIFRDTKNGETRGVPLHPRLVATLANLLHREGCVFRRPDGLSYARPRNIDDMSAGSRIKKAFAGACPAGLSCVTPHTCRHTWASWHYAPNRDLTALMRLGGWKTVSMVMRYAHGNVAELAPSIDRLLLGESWGSSL